MNATRVTWFDDRFYRAERPEGGVVFLPSSTTVLGIVSKPYLDRWRGRVGNDEADLRSYIATKRGTRVHELIHRLLKGDRIEYGANEQEVWRQVVNFHDWWTSLGPARVVASEEVVVSFRAGYAGTLDAVIETNDGLIVVDFKTGSGRDVAYTYQTASYAAAWREMYPDSPPIVATVVVYLGGKTTTTVRRNQKEWEQDLRVFKHALALYEAAAPARPKIFDMPSELKLIKKRKRRTDYGLRRK